MHIQSIQVDSFKGANKQPHSGTATFSDGKSYGFLMLPNNSIAFFVRRKRYEIKELVSFRSSKREAALIAYLL